METIQFKKSETIKLSVKISSDANVGSNVHLDDLVLKKSIANTFSLELGKIESIDGKTLSVVSNFFIHGGGIDAVIESTHVDCKLYSDTKEVTISAQKVKLNSNLFMAYVVVKLEKI